MSVFNAGHIDGAYQFSIPEGGKEQISALMELIYIRLNEFFNEHNLHLDLGLPKELAEINETEYINSLIELIRETLISYVKSLQSKPRENFSLKLKELLDKKIPTPVKAWRPLNYQSLDPEERLKLLLNHREDPGIYNLINQINSLLFASNFSFVEGIFRTDSPIYFLYKILYEVIPTCIDHLMKLDFDDYIINLKLKSLTEQ